MAAGKAPVIELWRAYLILLGVLAIMYIAGRIDCRNAYAAGWSNGFGMGLSAVPVETDPKPRTKGKRKRGTPD